MRVAMKRPLELHEKCLAESAFIFHSIRIGAPSDASCFASKSARISLLLLTFNKNLVRVSNRKEMTRSFDSLHSATSGP